MSSLDGTAWGSPQAPLDGDNIVTTTNESDANDEISEPPLQYAALWAECQPSNDAVSLQQLGRVLSRANIPNDSCALILEASCLPGQQRVAEQAFHRALALAAALQLNPSLDVHTTGAVPMREVKLDSEAKEPNISAVPDYNPTSRHTISVALMSKREGSFLSRHAVYTVSGEFQGKPFRVLRRFRDFAWLLESLAHNYPFRVLPVLPPKRLAMNGKYLTGASQDTFLQRRAEGLSRFVNLLVKHPVLAGDAIVSKFLFAETQFELVKGHTTPSDEFKDKVASPLFISQWSNGQMAAWDQVKEATQEFIQQVSSICLALERMRARSLAASDDAEIMGRNCLSLSRSLFALYPTQQEDLGAIQGRLETFAHYAESSKSAYAASSDALLSGPLMELRMYREMLSSVLELFKRLHGQGGNTIPELQRKIVASQKKLAAISLREDAREDDLHKLRTAIQAAQTSIREQTNRDWLIKQVITEELEMVQSMQYQLSRILRSAAEVADAAVSQRAEITSHMTDAAGTAPLKI